jgi:hypothetical protein
VNEGLKFLLKDWLNPNGRLLSPTDGDAYRFSNYAHYSLWIGLATVGVIFMLMPAQWFDHGARLANATEIVSSHWPKVKIESEFLNNIVPNRGAKYVLINVFCFSTVIISLLVTLLSLAKLLVQGGKKLTSSNTRFHRYGTILFLAWIFYLIVADTSMIMSTTHVSKGIGSAQILWFWIASLFTGLFHCIQLTFSLIVKSSRTVNK